MSLRTRLFLLFSALLMGLLALAWWGSRWLARDLTGALDRVAASVGQSVVAVFGEEHGLRSWVSTDHTRDPEIVVERIVRSDERTVRAKHRQLGSLITHLSIQVDDQDEQVLALPRPVTTDLANLTIDVTPIHSLGVDMRRLRLSGGNVQRDIEVSGAGVQSAVGAFSSRLLSGLAGLFGLGVLLSALIAHRVSAPLRRLQTAANRLGSGELGAQIKREGVSEVQATISAFNAMSQRLQALQQEQQRLRSREHLSEIGDIGRGLAHSLRNPLNAIGLTVDELAARASDSESSLRLARDARRQIRHIDQSIRTFLALASEPETAAAKVNLQSVVQDVALELAQQGGQVRIAGEAVELIGIEAELRAMIHALVVNAIEAGTTGQIVEVTLSKDGDQAQIAVTDRGSGIDPAIRERLFQPHATTKAAGSGMGLFLTQKMADSRYSGRVILAADERGGTRAVLQLGPRQGGVHE